MFLNSKHVVRLILGVSVAAIVAVTASSIVQAQAPKPATGVKYSQVSPGDLKEWLTYLASDELQGRAMYTEGYGLAAGYISENLRKWGVKPIGSNGTYLQIVKSRGYKVTRNSAVTVEAGGQSRTFKHGDHVTFPVNGGGKQTVAFTGVEFIGSAAPAPGANLKGKLAVSMPVVAAPGAGRGGRGGGGAAIAAGATGTLSYVAAPPAPSAATQALAEAQEALAKANAAVTLAQQQLSGARGGGFPGRGRGAAAAVPADITSVQNVMLPVAPAFTADETFYEFLLSASPMKFADLKARADRGETLAAFPINAKVTVNVDNAFEVVSQELSHNVVGMIEGSDPKLKDTYVMFGAHLDHVGYSTTGGGAQPSNQGCRARSKVAVDAVVASGKTTMKPAPGAPRAGGAGAGGAGGRGAAPAMPNAARFDTGDFISNGADDDGSGSAALLGVAKAFATGPRPKRSVVFIWHSGEERGLLGSRFNADFPIVPAEKVQTVLNMDMVGRDDCNNMEDDHSNGVFVVGADRISTDLHNLIIETNGTMVKPLQLDYEMNDPGDPENVYGRSDHFSYAAKGIPIAFFTTGLHPDYHRVTDTVDKILFPKMARITQLVYQTGFSVANTDKVLERDNKGPRSGYGTKAEIIKK